MPADCAVEIKENIYRIFSLYIYNVYKKNIYLYYTSTGIYTVKRTQLHLQLRS